MQHSKDLILASTSPYRRTLIARLGLPFRCIAPPIDEEDLKVAYPLSRPQELAESLAIAKAESVANLEPKATVIGGDQLVALDESILGKPGTAEQAIAQLQKLSGRSHELITAFAVLDQGKSYTHTNVTRLHLRPLTLLEITRYVETDQPLDCAGSYKLEALGITLFEKIESDDHSAIVGVPLIALTTILRTIGFVIP